MPDISKRCPVNGTFELTGRCNLNCKMCLVRVDKKRIEELGLRERTAEEWIDMARQAAEAGTLGLLLTGGEVMLRPDFCEIYEAIAKMGFLLTLYTNATMVTDEIMDVLERYPPHKIGVTMYGASNETYEKICGNPRGFDCFRKGINRLKSLPSLIETRVTLIKDNLSELDEMKSIIKKELGEAQLLNINRFVTKSIRGGIAEPEKYRLSPEENIRLLYDKLVDLYDELPEDKKKRKSYNVANKSKKNFTMESDIFSACGAGINQYTISWFGEMYGCELMPEGSTKPFKEGFLEAWEKLPMQYPSSDKINKKCVECPHAFICETCPAIRMSETGEWDGIPEYFCGEARYLCEILSSIEKM